MINGTSRGLGPRRREPFAVADVQLAEPAQLPAHVVQVQHADLVDPQADVGRQPGDRVVAGGGANLRQVDTRSGPIWPWSPGNTPAWLRRKVVVSVPMSGGAVAGQGVDVREQHPPRRPACRVLRVRDCGGADEAGPTGRLMRITGGAI